MPESRSRHKAHHHHQASEHHRKKKRKAATVMALFAALLGVIIVYIAAGSDPLWLVIGGIAGAVVGYFIGHNIDKTLKEDGLE